MEVQMNVKVEFYLCVSILYGSRLSVQAHVYSLWSWSVNVIHYRLKNLSEFEIGN